MRFWHYTVYPSFLKILEDGQINYAMRIANERPAVWLSTNPDWEETVRKAIGNRSTGEESEPLSRDELFAEDFIPVRLEIDPDSVKLFSWRNFKKNSGASRATIKALEKSAKQWGANPKEWYVCYEPILITSCLLPIEIWHGNEWIDIEREGPGN